MNPIKMVLVFFALMLLHRDASCQQVVWSVKDTTSEASLRGLASIDRSIAWVCGSGGAILQTRDGGSTWQMRSIPEMDQVEFRSIHAWDADRAVVATAGQPANIYKTIDGGLKWTTVYSSDAAEAFFDGLHFWDQDNGIAFSDPIDGRLLIVTSQDAGHSWTAIDKTDSPQVDTLEAGFAASNSSLAVTSSRLAWIGLGGGTQNASRVVRSEDRGKTWRSHPVAPIQHGPSSGIFSVAFQNDNSGVAVGGNYQLPEQDTSNIAITDDSGVTWRTTSGTRPGGYRSCVVYDSMGQRWITAGPSGCDFSRDRETWTTLSDIGFHAMHVAQDGTVWACGSKGRVAILQE
jgi:photosystem II stability/assembly factor-like uncharacterized protein